MCEALIALSLICELVEQAINTGYLDLTAEAQLRQLLGTKYDADDFRFFMKLQEAAMNGEVKLESHERRYQPERNSGSMKLKHLPLPLVAKELCQGKSS